MKQRLKRQLRIELIGLLALCRVLAACEQLDEPLGGTPPQDSKVESWKNQEPEVILAAPSALAVGEDLSILGQKFVEKAHGRVQLRFVGKFQDQAGAVFPVDLYATPEVVSGTELRWSMWPNIAFSPTGDSLGRFLGEVRVINQGYDGSEIGSKGLPLSIDMKPSLIPRIVQPKNKGCQPVVGHTHENTAMIFSVDAVGLRTGAPDSPLTFRWTFLSEQWNVSFTNGLWADDSPLPKETAVLIEDRVTAGTTSLIEDGSDRTLLIKLKDDLFGDDKLKRLRTASIPAEGNNMPISVNVAAIDGTGKTATLSIKIGVHRVADLIYNDETRIAERYPPLLVTDCIPGGSLGRHVSYYESSSESRDRTVSYSYNAELAGTLGLPTDPFALNVKPSVAFHVSLSERASSEHSTALHISGEIISGEYGSFYRQTVRLEKAAKLVGYSACGHSTGLGEVILTDWAWSADLARGPSCPPPSNLPAAGVY
jgi:hypothetical protein